MFIAAMDTKAASSFVTKARNEQHLQKLQRNIAALEKKLEQRWDVNTPDFQVMHMGGK
jgi:hypothetical protein